MPARRTANETLTGRDPAAAETRTSELSESRATFSTGFVTRAAGIWRVAWRSALE